MTKYVASTQVEELRIRIRRADDLSGEAWCVAQFYDGDGAVPPHWSLVSHTGRGKCVVHMRVLAIAKAVLEVMKVSDAEIRICYSAVVEATPRLKELRKMPWSEEKKAALTSFCTNELMVEGLL